MFILFSIVLILGVITYLVMQTAPFGKNPGGQRLERIHKSPNYKDGAFQNIYPTQMMASDASYFQMIKEYFGPENEREPGKSLPSVKRNLKEPVLREMPVITWFGHSTYLIQAKGKNILIDPVFSERPSPFQFVGSKSYQGSLVYKLEDFPGIDLVVFTHDHYDHLDYNTIDTLKNTVNSFIAPLGVGEHLEHWGIEPSKIKELDWWEETEFTKDIKFIATPARHFSGRGFLRNKTLWTSYVLIIGEQKIFIGGDSGYDDTFKKIGIKYGPFDIAMLESGQYNEKWPNIHMMPEETVQAAKELNTKILMPVHWGKFTLAMHPWKEPVERVLAKASELEVQTTTPVIGEMIVLDSIIPTSRWWK